MSGWGDWLEKGKALAATIDQQINESVGVENAGTAPSADLNDAWNDDFDDEILNQEPNGWNEEEIIMENLQQDTPKKEELFSSALPSSSGNETVVSSIPEPSTEPVQEGPSIPEVKPPATAISEDHFASPPPMPSSVKVDDDDDAEGSAEPPSGEGWDDDLHVDSHDMEEVVPEQTEPSPEKEKALDEVPPPEPAVKHAERDVQATVVELPAPVIVEIPETPAPKVIAEPETVEEKTPDIPPPEPVVEQPSVDEVPFEEVSETVVAELPAVVESESAPDQTETDLYDSQPVEEQVPPMDESFVSQSQVTDEKVLQLQEESQMAIALLQSQMQDLQVQLQQREDQLTSKAEQLTTMQAIFESEKDELRKKISDTKDEAKRRILKAKERVEAMEKRLASASKSAEDAGAQDQLIAALREEGEKLAHKQSEMEKAVRAAKGETRELTEKLDAETASKEKALAKIASLEADLKQTKEDLTAARKGESQVVKLDAELLSVKEECERRATTNLSLEQQVKELKAENKDLRTEVEQARRGAELENQAESKKLRKEHSELLSDLETKLRTSEREASLREDALRHEVAEIRKRWQDAVRRADALSMDVQQSTAPLLRQLESLERQSRARAANWADLETKLRSDLEDSVIENEKLVKERNDLKSTSNRLQRLMKDRDEELNASRSKLDDQSVKIKQLETKLSSAEMERQNMKEKYEEIEKVANEGVSKVRSDMMQTVVESEERYRSQIESAEKELRTERDIRSQLERQVEQLLENSGMVQLPQTPGEQAKIPEDKSVKLRSTQGQAEILANTLTGLDSDDDDEDGVLADDEDESASPVRLSSFAAMEELNQRLKGTTAELTALREQLADSERTRESLMEELIQTRQAREKLPLFEAKVKELTEENREKELELMGLRQDIQEVGQLYRTQLNALLEEKATAMTAGLNGGHKDESAAESDEQPVTESTDEQENSYE